LPVSDPADEIAVQLLGFQLSRLEAGYAAIERLTAEGDRGGCWPTGGGCEGLGGSTKRLLSELLLTPAGRARAARDLGVGRDAASRATARALEEHLARRRSAARMGMGDGAGERAAP
jgi:hypothetical protein